VLKDLEMAGIDTDLLEQILKAIKDEASIDAEIAKLKERIEEKKEQKKNGSQLLKEHKETVELLKKQSGKTKTAGKSRAAKIDQADRLQAFKATIQELKDAGTKEIKTSEFYKLCNAKLERESSADSVFYGDAEKETKIKSTGQKAGKKFQIG
jgi:small-conductance mechanosensitive channel